MLFVFTFTNQAVNTSMTLQPLSYYRSQMVEPRDYCFLYIIYTNVYIRMANSFRVMITA